MKIMIISAVMFIVLSLAGCGGGGGGGATPITSTKTTQTVLPGVCTEINGYAYHSDYTCSAVTPCPANDVCIADPTIPGEGNPQPQCDFEGPCYVSCGVTNNVPCTNFTPTVTGPGGVIENYPSP